MVIDEIKIKKLFDLEDELKKKDTMLKLFGRVTSTMQRFYDVWRPRRQRLLEINAIYRGKSYLDQNKIDWQTKSFYNLSYDAVERKTSLLLEALWGNKSSAPYTVYGRTAEDHEFAMSCEGHLNNTMDRIGFYPTSEANTRSVSKNGFGVYYYGWERRVEDGHLSREVVRNEKKEVMRDENGRAILKYARRQRRVSQLFVRNIDIVDHFGFDPSTKEFSPWMCDYAYIVDELSPEAIWRREQANEFYKGSFDRLAEDDPHGLKAYETMMAKEEDKEPQIRKDDGVMDVTPGSSQKPVYRVVRWWGWFDIDKDGKREFIEAVLIPEKKVVLRCQEVLLFEYPIVDIHFTRSLHGMTSWGVLDPVVDMQYEINERRAQRGDASKFKINPQFVVNMEKIYEDHSYVSMPGAWYPVRTGDRPPTDAISPVRFDKSEYLSWEDEDRDVATFARLTGVADLNSVLTSANKDTPASTVLAIFNEQQAGNSLVVNGVLERNGVLGSRVLKLIQLFGDSEFTYRSLGRRGVEFRTETMENILGEYDVKVTTSAFYGNRNMEVQQLINLRPNYAEASHIDLVEYDRTILESILPKRVDRIIRAASDPLTAMQEQALIIADQGESLTVSDSETLESIAAKLREHQRFMDSEVYEDINEETKLEFEEYLQKLADHADVLQQQMQQAQGGAQGGQVPGMGGNMANTGSPIVRQMGNQMRPKPNNLET